VGAIEDMSANLQVDGCSVLSCTRDTVLGNDALRSSSKHVLGHKLCTLDDYSQARRCCLQAVRPCILRTRSFVGPWQPRLASDFEVACLQRQKTIATREPRMYSGCQAPTHQVHRGLEPGFRPRKEWSIFLGELGAMAQLLRS
jgi:hypothetical protein